MQRRPWMESHTYSGICYHGTCIDRETEDPFTELDSSYSSYDAIWVTPDQYAAEQFAIADRSKKPKEATNANNEDKIST